MDGSDRVNAIAGPAPSVFPEGRPGFVGVLMLDTRFPRPLGDIGNPASFPVPALTRVVRGARPGLIVQDAARQRSAGLLRPFVRVMRELEDEGAAAITTSCGFLVLMQRELQAASRVPVVTSSLLLLPMLLGAQPQVGVLTISAEHLGAAYLQAAGVPQDRMADVLVEGVDPQGHFAQAILGDQRDLDFAAARRDVVAAALRLKARAPGLADVVLECTNMPPYARDVELATGLRAWSLLRSPALLAPFQGHLPRSGA